MIDFESCISLEKLVLDNEICGMMFRMLKGIEAKEDFPSIPLFEELLSEGHLLISKHTRKYLREEQFFPGNIINRANNARWAEEGSLTLRQRAHNEAANLVKSYEPEVLEEDSVNKLVKLMSKEASKFGQNKLPERI